MTLPICLLFTCLSWVAPKKETRMFTVFFGSSDIGTVTATKTTMGNTVHYKVFSDVEYDSWLYDHQRTTTVQGVMVNGQLANCSAYITEYGEVEINTSTRREGNRYLCTPHDGEPFYIDEPIDFISIMLYFEAPEGHSKVFSESHLGFCKVAYEGNGVYDYETPNGDENDYIYRNGYLQTVKIYRTLVNLTIERQ